MIYFCTADLTLTHLTLKNKDTTSDLNFFAMYGRAVARSENPRGLVVLGGVNVSPLVEIGLIDLPNSPPPSPPACDGPDVSAVS